MVDEEVARMDQNLTANRHCVFETLGTKAADMRSHYFTTSKASKLAHYALARKLAHYSTASKLARYCMASKRA